MRRNKYNVAPKKERTLDGIVFDSKREMKRYAELKLLEQTGQIEGLELQTSYEIKVNGIYCGQWIGDFSYREGDKFITEDAKGVKTPLYKFKKKLVEALYGFEVQEV